MRGNRWVAIAALMILAGCGGEGEKTHDVASPYAGAVYGVETVPVDSELSVPTDAWIRVYWPDANFPPPSGFTVRMESVEPDGTWASVYSKQRDDHSNPDAASWWFEPTDSLSSGTWYRVTITDGVGRQCVLCFHTEGSMSAASLGTASSRGGVAYRPEGADKPAPPGTKEAAEHTIRTGR